MNVHPRAIHARWLSCRDPKVLSLLPMASLACIFQKKFILLRESYHAPCATRLNFAWCTIFLTVTGVPVTAPSSHLVMLHADFFFFFFTNLYIRF
jgi:hypothetical protein